MNEGIFRQAIAAGAALLGRLADTEIVAALRRADRCLSDTLTITLVCIVSSLTACGGNSGDAAAQATTPQPVAGPTGTPSSPAAADTGWQAPTISGSPQTLVDVGGNYWFQPQAAGATGTTLSFRAENQPAWLSLDTATGALSGSPKKADVGIYQNIVLSVTDGKVVTSMPPFGVQVRASIPTPYTGTALAVPGTVDAVRFDLGGEGVGYHDTTPGNTGGGFRGAEDVDIRMSSNGLDGPYVVNNLEAGEWLAYSIDVTKAGKYEIWLRTSSALSGSTLYVQLDGRNVSGQVNVTNTGNWDTFEWVGGTILSLSAGRHIVTVVADRPYFDLDAITIVTPKAPGPPAVLPVIARPDPATVNFFCSFTTLPDCALEEQSKVPGRASLTSIARDGGTALRLHTEPGDDNVVFSGAMERNDVWLSQAASDGYEGHEAWWAHSILFPDDFTIPTWQAYVVFDFHNTDTPGIGPGQANFHVSFEPQADPTQPGVLRFIGYGGAYNTDGVYEAVIGRVEKNVWYDFVYHVRWSSGPSGFFDAWVNGKRVLAHQGPTLYTGQGVYLKLANYHTPICDPLPVCNGTDAGSSVIHDRIVRGTTAAAVSTGPLEGYLDLVNGALIPRF